MQNTVRCWEPTAHEHSKNSRFRQSMLELIPWVYSVECFLPYFYMAGATAVIIWVSVHGSNITAVFICPILLLVML